MTKYLITSSLLNSFQYYIQDEYKSPADSRADFLRTLSRERFEPNEAMQKGIDFENDIKIATEYKYEYWQDNKTVEYDSVIDCLANIVQDGIWQQTCKKDLTIGNQEFLLYGKCDVVKRDTIYDIKFTSNYEVGKFLDSAQHLIYLYCLDLPKFQYLVSDGEEYWVEDYHNHAEIEDEIKSKISDFLSYLENDKEAKEMFFTKWGSK